MLNYLSRIKFTPNLRLRTRWELLEWVVSKTVIEVRPGVIQLDFAVF
jgi:hypothetical protein